MAAWSYLEQGGRRAVLAWHRRFGKDSLSLNWAAVASQERVASYWHMLPQANQARKAIWAAVNPHTGQRLIDQAFPHEIREKTLDQEMMIKFKNGSTWQVVGSDNYNALVGSAPAGIVFSEYALADPASWAFLRPILLENKGWALFISTPRGQNHFAKLLSNARTWDDWFAEVLTAEDTGIFDPASLERERLEYIAEHGEEWGENLFRQEYLCDFSAAIRGAYFGRLMEQAEKDGRVGTFDHDPKHKVGTAWDLGMGDHTVVWCFQLVGTEIRIIDVIASSGVGLDWYVKQLQAKPYVFDRHILPHDVEVRELGTGVSRKEVLDRLGMRPITVAPRFTVDDGISALRLLIPRMRFDATRCGRLVEALKVYRAEYDDKLQTLKPTPLHDWASHFADAGRYLALGLREVPAGAMGPAQLPRRRIAA